MTAQFWWSASGKKEINGEHMINKVEQYMSLWNMLEEGDRIVLGVSGGADSVALLLMLQTMQQKYHLKLYGVHVNHGIRKEAAEDAAYVSALCESLDVPFYLYEADIPAMAKEQGMSEEEMGRIYRYQCFREVSQQVDANKIAVAHHMDDQAETVLFHLARGSKLTGAEGMHPTNGNVIRPLLACRKEELMQWLREQQVSWMEDSTNGDDMYARNCIRNQVIPALERVNTQAVRHLVEFAEEMGAYRQFVQQAVDEYFQQAVCFEGECCTVNRNHLLQQDVILAKAVIYEMLTQVCGKKKDICSTHVQLVYDLLRNQSGKKIILPYEMIAELSYEMLKIRKSLQVIENDTIEEVEIDWRELVDCKEEVRSVLLPRGRVLNLQLYQKKHCTRTQWENLINEAIHSKNNYTKYFECDTIKFTLCIRNTRNEDYFVMNEKGERKKLSRYFIDQKIPVEQRSKKLVLAVESNVLWILGDRRSEMYKVSQDSEVIVKLIYEGE